MKLLLSLFLTSGLFICILGWIAVSGERRFGIKMLAYMSVITLFGTSWFAYSELLSRSKPIDLTWFEQATDVEVISAHMVEDESIFLWLGLPKDSAPRAYVMPWTEDNAKAIHKAGQQAEQAGAKMRMKNPFRNTASEEKTEFYAAPQAPPVPKHVQVDTPLDVTVTD